MYFSGISTLKGLNRSVAIVIINLENVTVPSSDSISKSEQIKANMISACFFSTLRNF